MDIGGYAAPVFPLDYIGPSPLGGGMGSESVAVATGFEKIEGDKIKPSPMMPPEIEMGDEQLRRLKEYLRFEISTCEQERWSQIAKFSRLKQKYRTKFPEMPKNFPIPNSSQITIPVIKTHVDTLTSQLFQTVMAAEPMASVRAKDEDPQIQEFVDDWERFLQLYSEEKLQHEDVFDTALTESIKLGTSVIEVTRKLDRRKVVDFDAATGKYTQVAKEVFNGPFLYNIPIEDFWCRPEWQDPQTAPWCGKVLRMPWSQIKDMAVSGEIDADQINNLWKLPVNPGYIPDTVRDDAKQEKTEPQFWEEYRLFELCVRWDVDGDGIDEDIIVYYHWESNTLLRRKFNTFNRRPYEIFRFKKIEYRFYGEGMAEILEQLQEEISTQHNQRIDNATIASLKLILTERAIPGIRPGDPVWPGKVVKAKPGSVEAWALGEIYPSTIENEKISQAYAKEASGVGENAFNAQPVSRTTAAAQLSLLEERNRRFDKTLKGYRKNIRNIYLQLTYLFNQTGTGGLAELWFGPEKGQLIEQVITMPADMLANKIKIQVTSTKATINRQVELQTNIAVMNLIIQNGEQLLALVQNLAPQVLPVVAGLLIKSIGPVYKKVLQYADAPNTDEAIQLLSFLENILPSPENMGGMAPQGGPPPAVPPQGGGAPGAVGGPGANGNGTGAAAAPDVASRLGDIMSAVGQVNGRLQRMGGKRGQP